MPRERVVNLGSSYTQIMPQAGGDTELLWHFKATGAETELNVFNETLSYFNKVRLIVNGYTWRSKNAYTIATGLWQYEVLTDGDGNNYGIALNTAGGAFLSPNEPVDVWYIPASGG